MVFLDGTQFVARDGAFRAPAVLNNLIARKELPVMAAVFIDPGEAPRRIEYEKASDGSPLFWQTYLASRFNNRSAEYEAVNSNYADFLAREVLPQIRRVVRITDDPNGRGVGGVSSGAFGAFTIAWHRPEQFRKVFAGNGSFLSTFRGAPGYPQLVRESERKPLRLFFQDGSLDKSRPEFGVGEERHRDLLMVLKDKGYDYEFVFGEGTHSPAHAASILPQAMRWLWRNYPR
jgi:enterochelin esterase-like enzyme